MSLSVLSSVAPVPASSSLSVLAAAPATAVAQSAPAAATASTATSTAAQIATTGSSSLQAVTKDLVALLKALASGNVSESRADLARLQNDIKAQESASATATTASEQPPFNVVLNRVAESLAAADTGKALQELATYLIQGGQSSGNIVDERA